MMFLDRISILTGIETRLLPCPAGVNSRSSDIHLFPDIRGYKKGTANRATKPYQAARYQYVFSFRQYPQWINESIQGEENEKYADAQPYGFRRHDIQKISTRNCSYDRRYPVPEHQADIYRLPQLNHLKKAAEPVEKGYQYYGI